jgi:hypothetical protein
VIQAAISHLAERLNEFLARGMGLSEDIVVVSHLVEQDGSVAPGVANKLVLFLTNIEKESAAGLGHATHFAGQQTGLRAPSVNLNLYLILAANFTGSNYPEALKMISAAILFFQRNPIFDRQSSPGLDRRIEKLVLDIENMGRQDLSNLWGGLGAKYLPSVLYKMRMLTFDAQDIQALEPQIKRPELNVKA